MARTQGSHASGTGAIRLDQVTEAKHPVLHGAPLHKRGERGNGGLSCGRNVPAVPARLPQVASNRRPRCVAQPFQFAGKPVRRASCPGIRGRSRCFLPGVCAMPCLRGQASGRRSFPCPVFRRLPKACPGATALVGLPCFGEVAHPAAMCRACGQDGAAASIGGTSAVQTGGV